MKHCTSILHSLLGTWRDQQGSTYQLSLQADGWSLNVTTHRPDGNVRCTPGLIRMETEENSTGSVVWGKGFRLDCSSIGVATSWPSSICWKAKDARKRSFTWTRVEGPTAEQSSTDSFNQRSTWAGIPTGVNTQACFQKNSCNGSGSAASTTIMERTRPQIKSTQAHTMPLSAFFVPASSPALPSPLPLSTSLLPGKSHASTGMKDDAELQATQNAFKGNDPAAGQHTRLSASKRSHSMLEHECPKSAKANIDNAAAEQLAFERACSYRHALEELDQQAIALGLEDLWRHSQQTESVASNARAREVQAKEQLSIALAIADKCIDELSAAEKLVELRSSLEELARMQAGTSKEAEKTVRGKKEQLEASLLEAKQITKSVHDQLAVKAAEAAKLGKDRDDAKQALLHKGDRIKVIEEQIDLLRKELQRVSEEKICLELQVALQDAAEKAAVEQVGALKIEAEQATSRREHLNTEFIKIVQELEQISGDRAGDEAAAQRAASERANAIAAASKIAIERDSSGERRQLAEDEASTAARQRVAAERAADEACRTHQSILEKLAAIERAVSRVVEQREVTERTRKEAGDDAHSSAMVKLSSLEVAVLEAAGKFTAADKLHIAIARSMPQGETPALGEVALASNKAQDMACQQVSQTELLGLETRVACRLRSLSTSCQRGQISNESYIAQKAEVEEVPNSTNAAAGKMEKSGEAGAAGAADAGGAAGAEHTGTTCFGKSEELVAAGAEARVTEGSYPEHAVPSEQGHPSFVAASEPQESAFLLQARPEAKARPKAKAMPRALQSKARARPTCALRSVRVALATYSKKRKEASSRPGSSTLAEHEQPMKARKLTDRLKRRFIVSAGGPCKPPGDCKICFSQPCACMSHFDQVAELESVAQRLDSLPESEREIPKCVSYCFDWLSKGYCRRKGRGCSYLHAVQDHACPTTADNFTFRIDDRFKRTVNIALARLSADLPDRRCFILDGINAATTKALGRPKGMVLAPNIDPNAVAVLKTKALACRCTSSMALTVAAKSGTAFGCIYLDYMWPLDYFAKRSEILAKETKRQEESFAAILEEAEEGGDRSVALRQVMEANLDELDGFRDIERLFGEPSTYSLLSPTGTVLAVTVVYDKKSPLAKQQRQLEKLLCVGCKRLGITLSSLGKCRPKGRNVATLFFTLGLSLPRSAKKGIKGLDGKEVQLYRPSSQA